MIRIILIILCLSSSAFASNWHAGSVTTYANKFEGRKTSSGRIFRHKELMVACKRGKLGSRIELRYGKRARVIATICDRGGLPLHSDSKWQFDVSKAVARKLGLYRLVKGQTDRTVYWRFLDVGTNEQVSLLGRHNPRPCRMAPRSTFLALLCSANSSDQALVYRHSSLPVACDAPHYSWLQNDQRQILPVHALRGQILVFTNDRRIQSQRRPVKQRA